MCCQILETQEKENSVILHTSENLFSASAKCDFVAACEPNNNGSNIEPP